MGDQTRGTFDSAQDTGKSYLNQAQDTLGDVSKNASDSMPSQGQAEGATKGYVQQAQDTATDIYNKAASNAPSSGEAQGQAQGMAQTVQDYVQSGVKVAQDTFQGMYSLTLCSDFF